MLVATLWVCVKPSAGLQSKFHELNIYISNIYLFYYIIYLYLYLFIYFIIYIYTSSSSSCCATSTDIPDPLSLLFPIVHRLWQVFKATFRILT